MSTPGSERGGEQTVTEAGAGHSAREAGRTIPAYRPSLATSSTTCKRWCRRAESRWWGKEQPSADRPTVTVSDRQRCRQKGPSSTATINYDVWVRSSASGANSLARARPNKLSRTSTRTRYKHAGVRPSSHLEQRLPPAVCSHNAPQALERAQCGTRRRGGKH